MVLFPLGICWFCSAIICLFTCSSSSIQICTSVSCCGLRGRSHDCHSFFQFLVVGVLSYVLDMCIVCYRTDIGFLGLEVMFFRVLF